MNCVKKILRNRSIAWALACTMFILITGCMDDDDPNITNVPVAYVSFFHGSPNAPGLNVEVDNKPINGSPFDYAGHTGYLRLYPGDRNLKFGPYASSSVNIDTIITFEANKAYSVFVADEFENGSVVVLSDNADPAASGKAKVRIINLSPNAGDIDFKAVGETNPWATDLKFKDATGFTEVDAGEFDFEVRASDNDALLLSVPNTRLESRYFYTIVIRGYDTPPGGNVNVLAAQLIVN